MREGESEDASEEMSRRKEDEGGGVAAVDEREAGVTGGGTSGGVSETTYAPTYGQERRTIRIGHHRGTTSSFHCHVL